MLTLLFDLSKKRLNGFRHLIMFLLIAFHLFSRAQPIIDTVWTETDTVGRYKGFTLSLGITTQVSNVFNYDRFHLRGVFQSPSGRLDTIDGFFYQDYQMTEPDVLVPVGEPFWKIRIAPDETGLWKVNLICSDSTGTVEIAGPDFYCVPSGEKGFLKLDGNFLRYEDGDYFFPVGQNLCWSDFQYGFYNYKRWTDSLSLHGANHVKIIFAPWSFEMEWGENRLGNYTHKMNQAWALDWVMDMLEEKGIYCTLVPMIHDEVRIQEQGGPYHWQQNPYNAQNGGPCENPWDFFTNQEARELFKRKLKYMISRWGYSPRLMTWELFTEIDNFPYYEEHSADIRAWVLEMGAYLEQNDIRPRPFSVSYAVKQHDSLTWLNERIDYTQLHLYNVPEGDQELNLFINSREYLKAFGKTHIVGEAGAFSSPSELIELDPRGLAFHNALWSSSFTGSFAGMLMWHWDSYIDTLGLYHHFNPLTEFMKAADLGLYNEFALTPFTFSDSNLNVSVTPKFFSLSEKAPVDTFIVERNGNFYPAENQLGSVLYGTDMIGQNLRNPPVFQLNQTQQGKLIIETGDVVVSGSLLVKLDGELTFSAAVAPNTVYEISIPEGTQYIRIENTGTAFASSIEIKSYIFENYAPVLRAFAMKGGDHMTGWLQNRLYSWKHFYESTADPAPASGYMLAEGLSPGDYEVKWWNPSTGMLDSVSTYTAGSSGLQLNIPALLWDVAFTIDRVVGISEQAGQRPYDIRVFPLPARGLFHVEYALDEAGDVCFELFDLSGKLHHSESIQHDSRGNFSRSIRAEYPVGIYYLRVSTSSYTLSEKLILL